MLTPRLKDWKGIGSVGTVGLEVVVAIIVGLLAGRWLDGRFDTAPYLAVVGFFFGVATAVKAIVRAWRDMQREAAREELEEGNPAPLFDSKPPDSKPPDSKPRDSKPRDSKPRDSTPSDSKRPALALDDAPPPSPDDHK
jgi:hypothetical protein